MSDSAGSVWADIESARLVYTGRLFPDSSWAMSAHTHNFWEFIYFLEGSGRICLPQGVLHPQPYHMAVYPPGLSHDEVSNPADPEGTVYIGIDVKGNPPADAYLLLADPRGELRWLCERIHAECLDNGVTALATAYMRAFLCLTERLWDKAIPVHHDIVELAMQYIHCNYVENISPRLLADTVHTSETYLLRKFKETLGLSPIRYLQRVRIETAKRLLLTSLLPVSEISRLVGIDDPFYFSRLFKRMTGLSPKDYRKLKCSAALSISGTP